MNAREDCVAADATWPEPTATLELTTEEARRLLHVLETTLAPSYYRHLDGDMRARLGRLINELNPPPPPVYEKLPDGTVRARSVFDVALENVKGAAR